MPISKNEIFSVFSDRFSCQNFCKKKADVKCPPDNGILLPGQLLNLDFAGEALRLLLFGKRKR
jgi:hypothetical protein